MSRAKGRSNRKFFRYSTTGKIVSPDGGFFAYNTDRINTDGGPGVVAFDGAAAGGSSASYLVREEDGTSKIILEEGGGFLLLEESA